jgi:hypothetical protein
MARWIAAIIAIALFLAVIGLLGWPPGLAGHFPRRCQDINNSGQRVSLVRPAFAQTGSFLDQEAGIAAYVKVPGLVNLESVKGAFKITEQETSDFVVCTVEITNAPLPPTYLSTAMDG